MLSPEPEKGYLVHWDTNPTSEGLGSHCRGSLYPLLHIAIHLGLQPIWRTENASWQTNLSRDYSTLDMGGLFGLDQYFDEKECYALEFHTWSDKQIGTCCGQAPELVESIRNYVEGHGLMKSANKAKAAFVIYLHGPFKYMNPSPPVYRWLKNRSRTWPHHDGFQVAAHVRVPEAFCGDSWKEDNSVDKLIHGLRQIQGLISDNDWALDVYTEEAFREEDEDALRKEFGHVRVHRGSSNTLLSDLQQMATADLFLPSASHLSATVGYLSTGVTVLTHAQSRMAYFQYHIDLGCTIVDVNDETNMRLAIRNVMLAKRRIETSHARPSQQRPCEQEYASTKISG